MDEHTHAWIGPAIGRCCYGRKKEDPSTVKGLSVFPDDCREERGDEVFFDLHRMIDAHVAIALREKKAGAERHARIRVGLDELLLEETKRFGCRLADADVLKVFDADLELNTQGLVVWLDNDK